MTRAVMFFSGQSQPALGDRDGVAAYLDVRSSIRAMNRDVYNAAATHLRALLANECVPSAEIYPLRIISACAGSESTLLERPAIDTSPDALGGTV